MPKYIYICHDLQANPTVMVIQLLGKKSIQTNRDIPDVLRHIIKNVSKRLFRNILSGPCHTNLRNLFFSTKKRI